MRTRPPVALCYFGAILLGLWLTTALPARQPVAWAQGQTVMPSKQLVRFEFAPVPPVGLVLKPAAIYTPEPVWPLWVEERHGGERIAVRLAVSATGSVLAVEFDRNLSSSLREVVAQTVRAWQYEPAGVRGTSTWVPVVFVIAP